MGWASLIVVAAVIGAGLAVVVEGPGGGDWAGALWMFVPLLVFAGVGAAECLRGDLGESRTAWLLAGVLGFQSIYYVVRTVVFIVAGPESAVFENVFGTVNTSMLTVILTIVAVVVTSVLRASRAPIRGYQPPGAAASDDGISTQPVFEAALAGLCERAARRSELVAVISVRVDDLEQISTAFGSEVARVVSETWRTGVRRHAPSNALVGEDAASGLLVGALVGTERDARRDAAVIYRGLFDDLGGVAGGVIPVVGVGVALSDVSGYGAAELSSVARDAAARAAASIETSVLVAEAD